MTRQSARERLYWWGVRHTKAMGLFLLVWTLYWAAWFRRELRKIGPPREAK